MDSDELRALIAVAATGSYHAAARRLGVSRSTLRRRVAELEARVVQRWTRRSRSGPRAETRVVRRSSRDGRAMRSAQFFI